MASQPIEPLQGEVDQIDRIGNLLEATSDSLPIGMSIVDSCGRVRFANRQARELLGFAMGTGASSHYESANITLIRIDGTALSPDEYPCRTAIREQRIVRDFEFGVLHDDGKLIWVSVTAMPTEQRGALVTYIDVTDRRRHDEVHEARLRLVERAQTVSLSELLQATLDEAELLTGSQIGFYHFLEGDQRTLSLQAWSTRTEREFCKAGGKGQHYSVDKAGVWVDCVHSRQPVVHNDYPKLPHKKGLPPGHAVVARELVVPVVRGGLIVAILGVGNKPQPYGPWDVRKVQYLADLAWELAEKKRLEEAYLIKSAALDCSPSGVALADLGGRIHYVNEAFARLWGLQSPNDALGRETQEFWEAPSIAAEVMRAVAEGHDARGEMVATRVDGSSMLVEYTASLIRNSNGTAVGLLGTFLDISERRRLEQQVRDAQKMESLGILAGGVAHDMNNILGAIMGITSLLREDVDDGDSPLAKDYETIVQACARGRTMVRGLLDFTRQEPTDFRNLDLNVIVREQCALLEKILPSGVRLELHTALELKRIHGDTSKLQRVLLNLCTNALDAVGSSGCISVLTRNTDSDEVELEVADDGSGMEAEVLAKAFEPFFTTKAIGKGTGLGLAIVYGTVKAHQGRMEILSSPGAGTRVTVRFPAHSTTAPPSVKADTRKSTAVSAALNVLLVDDDPLVQRSVSSMIVRLGHHVSSALNGRVALDMLRKQSDWSLVVLDLNMPVLDGAGVLPLLRQMYPDVPVIIATGRPDQAAKDLAQAYRCVSLLPKPFTLEEFRSHVEQVTALP